MEFKPGDLIEATEAKDTERGRIEVGARHSVKRVSAARGFILLDGSDAYVRASGWRLLEREV